MENTYKRQTAIFNPADHTNARAYIIGLGNIGSHTALALARMGIQNFVLCDFDSVEAHNLASQAYTIADIGKNKCDALAVHMTAVQEGVRVLNIMQSYQRACENGNGVQNGDIVIIAVDSLETRREIATLIKDIDAFVIDGRMGGGQIEVHTIHAKKYASIIPSEASDDECSARYISYTALMIAGAIANTVKRYLQKESVHDFFMLHTDTWQVLSGARKK